MTSVINSTRIVLQGEFAIVKADDVLIKTTIPKTCSVFTLYNKSKVRVLAHVDDYTGAVKAIIHISGILENRFNKPIKSFTAKVFGGTDDPFSKQQQQLILSTFKRMEIDCSVIPLSKDTSQRVQSVFNANGEVVFLEEEKMNNRLEYLQFREYGNFNDILDGGYGHLPGDQIPSFEIKEASRLEKDIPSFEMKNLSQISIERAQLAERKGVFRLPIQAERTVIQDNKEIITKLQSLLEGDISDSIKKSIEKRDFNLLLRQLSMKAAHVEPLKFLLDNKIKLNINIASRGETSGAAMDIAKKLKNQQAVDLLK